MENNNNDRPFSIVGALGSQLGNSINQPEIDDNMIEDLNNPVATIHPAQEDVDVNLEDTNLSEERLNPEPGNNAQTKDPVVSDPNNEEEDTQIIDPTEENQVGLLFDSFSESLGWEASEKKPKTIEELINYVGEMVDQTQPEYASDEVREINEFISNGGKLDDYLRLNSQITDYDNLNLDDSSIQKQVLTDFLKAQGLNNEAITRRINRYEDAGMLADEANDAADYMKESMVKEKETLIKQQEQLAIKQEQEQEEFYNNVNKTIDTMSSIRGMDIPMQDKKQLKDYLFKLDADGKSQYEKDFSSNLVTNLLESAYFTMKGDALIKTANKKGETSAINKLRQSLRSSSTSGRSSHEIDNGAAKPIWSAVANQLGSANVTI